MKLKKLLLPMFFTMGVLLMLAYWMIQWWLGPQLEGVLVAKADLVQNVIASGTVELPEPINVTSKIDGKIAAVQVVEGQLVHAGQILLTLENKFDRAILEKARIATVQAEARFNTIRNLTQAGSEQSLLRAKNALASASKQYTRTKDLSSKGLVSTSQLNETLRNLTIAQSQLATAQFQAKEKRAKGSNYALAELALKQARLHESLMRSRSNGRIVKAESTGILIANNAVQGDIVLPGKTLMVISPQGKPQLLVQFDQKHMGDVTLDQQAVITIVGHSDQQFYALVKHIDPSVDTARGVFHSTLDVINPPDYLSQNMPVLVALKVPLRSGVLSIPTANIHDADGVQPWVMMVDNGHARRKDIKLGNRTDVRIEIIDGLHEGDLVLSGNGLEVEEGKRIRLALSL